MLTVNLLHLIFQSTFISKDHKYKGKYKLNYPRVTPLVLPMLSTRLIECHVQNLLSMRPSAALIVSVDSQTISNSRLTAILHSIDSFDSTGQDLASPS